MLSDQRTVRAQGADRPPFRPSAQPEMQRLWYKFLNARRTVRAPVADRPPFNFLFPPETTQVSGTILVRGVDRPLPRGGPSVLHFSAPPEAKKPLWYIFELYGGPFAPQGWTVRT